MRPTLPSYPASPSAYRPSGSGPQAGGSSLAVIAREWGRIGCIGFGGPPTHVALLRELCVTQRRWLTVEEFERAIGATNMLPGPASTQLAIYCAWRVRGRSGALLGGACFIAPGLVLILALAALFLAGSPPRWLHGASLGAGAAVAAVALRAGLTLAAPMWARTGPAMRPRVLAYGLAGGLAAALAGPWLVLVLLGCGLLELGLLRLVRTGMTAQVWPVWPVLLLARGMSVRAAMSARIAMSVRAAMSARAAHTARAARVVLASSVARATSGGLALPVASATAAAPAGVGALAWTALKVGALAFGGGFVIIPLMQGDAVSTYHWMTHSQFLSAVALGQVTPGPVVLTVAVVGYAAAGVPGGLLATVVAFAPSFLFVLLGASRFEGLLVDARARAFMSGAAPAATGAIIGSAIPLARAMPESWQYPVLAGAVVLLFAMRRTVVTTLLLAGGAGVVVVLLGAPLPS